MDSAASFAALDGRKYLNLESYRRSGTGVRTPVWFASADAKLYVFTTTDSGKAKRIRNSGAVKLAPCDARGKTAGPWIDAHAEIVTGDEADAGLRMIGRKYRPWKQVLDLFARFRGHQHKRIVLAIRPG